LTALGALGAKRTLVVAPLNVVDHWCAEALRWRGDMLVLNGTGTAVARADAIASIVRGGSSPLAVVVNYEAFRADHVQHIAAGYDAVVFDEAHRLKNRKAQVHKAAVKVARRVPNLVLVTGTPIVNRADESWAALRLIDPRRWSSYWAWAHEHFELSQITPRGRAMRPVTTVGNLLGGHAEIVREQIGAHLIQRPLDVLLPELPEVTETEIWVDLTDAEYAAYRSMEERSWANIGGAIVQAPNRLAQLTRLRQMSSGWSMLGGVPGGAKVKATVELAGDLAPEQVVVVAAYQETARHIANALAGDRVVTYTGDDSADARRDARCAFRSGAARVIVGTHGAIGEGVDGLQVARHMILHDLDWTPKGNEQAVARIQRSGQQAKVNVYKMLARCGLDEDVLALLNKKQDVITALLGGRSDAVHS